MRMGEVGSVLLRKCAMAGIAFGNVLLSACLQEASLATDTAELTEPRRDSGLQTDTDAAVDFAVPDVGFLSPCMEAEGPATNIEAQLEIYQQSSGDVAEYLSARWRENLWIEPSANTLGCAASCRVRRSASAGDAGVGASDGGPPELALLSMTGTVTIEGLRATAIILTTTNPSFLQYYARGIEGGEPLVAKATGTPGGLPAFEAAWGAPAGARLDEPAPGRGLVSVDPLSDLSFTWTPSSPGEGTLFLSIFSQRTDEISGLFEGAGATCSFPVRSGRGVIPAVVLRTLGDYSSDYSVGVAAQVGTSTTVEIEGHRIRFEAHISIAQGRFELREPDAGVDEARDAGPIDSALGADS